MASQSGTARLSTPRSPASALPAPPFPVMTIAVFFPLAWQSCRNARSRRRASSWRSPCRSITAPGAVLPRRSRCSSRRSSVASGGRTRASRGLGRGASSASPSRECFAVRCERAAASCRAGGVTARQRSFRRGLASQRLHGARHLGPDAQILLGQPAARTARRAAIGSIAFGSVGARRISAWPLHDRAGAPPRGESTKSRPDGAGGPRASRPRPRCPRIGRHGRPRRSPRRYPARS